ncbi:MAG: DUF3693 domain-containing protein [Salinarimonas sp.]
MKAYIAAEAAENFRITQFWKDILDRLKITGLREGVRLEPGRARFLFVADGSPRFGIPTIKLAYECIGDRLTVYAAQVVQPGEDEDG